MLEARIAASTAGWTGLLWLATRPCKGARVLALSRHLAKLILKTGGASMTGTEIKPNRHLAEAGQKVWPDILWKSVTRTGVPVVLLGAQTGSGEKWRIIDCTLGVLNEDQIAYVRSVIFKSSKKGIISVAISVKGSETEEALYENVYAVHPYFMAARLQSKSTDMLEVLDSPEDVLASMSAQDFFISIERGRFRFQEQQNYLGNRFIEYVNHYCRKCRADLFCATGMIQTKGNAASQVSQNGRGVPHIGINECSSYLDESALRILGGVGEFGGTPVATLVWTKDKSLEGGSFQSVCTACNTKQKNGALAFNIRLDKLDNPRTNIQRTFKYVPIVEDGLIWDYDLVESRKADHDLFDDIGANRPGWVLADPS